MGTESLIVGAQNQRIRTNSVKSKINRSQEDLLCRLSKKEDGGLDHVVSGCSKLAEKEYKWGHNDLEKIVH